ncbi:hypothetical protein ASAP_0867 [Asaia bogorensis]|uniref:Uncharacterized protein n=1 Tax=Asaia bogorensis TaxID=91915 RepID=A0A060QJF1_9PROT|nr:hypothetical protein ASAP_0867 [Asaia bogorensis]
MPTHRLRRLRRSGFPLSPPSSVWRRSTDAFETAGRDA